MFNEKSYVFNLGNTPVTISTGKIARQAGGSVMVQAGKTVLLVTATRSKEVRDGQDFFPLTVDYIEKFYASGKFPGGFIKRESRPSTAEILIARLVDRPIRPLFPDGFLNGVHITITVMSFDEVNMPENLATIGVSAALGLSDIPFIGTVAGVTVGYVDGQCVLSPTAEQLENGAIYLSVAGTKDAITMVEAGAREVSEEIMLEAIMFGHDRIKEICAEQDKFLEQFNVQKYNFVKKEVSPEVKEFVEASKGKLEEAILTDGKQERYDAIDELEAQLLEGFTARYENGELPSEIAKEIKNHYHELMKNIVRDAIINKEYRPDGRKTTEIRAIDVEVDTLPMPHGSALFTRGETQALVIATLGTKDDEQIVDGLDEEIKKKTYFLIKTSKFSVRFQRIEATLMAPEKYIDEQYLSKVIGVGTNEDATSHLRDMDLNFSYSKPESVIAFLLQATTSEDDLILDYFAGSGTTCAVAHKMGRRYIGIEQMDYIEDCTVKRMKKVIDGEEGGISKIVDWQGGGSFLYCEFLENANVLIEKIQVATESDISTIKESIYSDERIVPYITREGLNKADEDFETLSLEDKKKALISLVDKSKLYVNYSDMEDQTFKVSKSDKIFTKSFYKEV